MCGRYVTSDRGNLQALFDLDAVEDDTPEQKFNVAPTTEVQLVVAPDRGPHDGKRIALGSRWGLLPRFAKDASFGSRTFNARSETMLEKPSFRGAVKKSRALVPATGYYEWQRAGQSKTPFFMHPKSGAPIAFAGLYSWWPQPDRAEDADDRWLMTNTIVTRESAGQLRELHDRMPVMVPRELWADWLDPTIDDVASLVDAVVAATLEVSEALDMYEVDRAVGNVHNQGPELMAPVEK